MRKRLAVLGAVCAILGIAGGLFFLTTKAHADSIPSSFSLIVTPSPLVTTVTPGQTTSLQVKILNNGTGTENLEMLLRSFAFSSSTNQVTLNDSPPAGVSSWVSFSAPKFTVAVGQWFTETVRITVPQAAGFSYSFALDITRQVNPTPNQTGQVIKGSIADFVLLNVNRPGATRQLTVPTFTVSKHIYEWLPASFTIKFANTGNTIVQPTGNIFIERSASAKTPIDTLPVNSNGGYILPSTTRAFSSSWSDGFPVYQTVTSASGTTSQHLTWNWSKFSTFRFGRYTAELVAVYNNGTEDVPIQGQVTFWVIPWVALLVILVVSLLILFGLWSIFRPLIRRIRNRVKRSRPRK